MRPRSRRMLRTSKAVRSQTRTLGLLKHNSGVRFPASWFVWLGPWQSDSLVQRRGRAMLPRGGRMTQCLMMLVAYFIRSITKTHWKLTSYKKEWNRQFWALWATASRNPSPHSLLEDTTIPKPFWQPTSLCFRLKLVSVGLCVRHALSLGQAAEGWCLRRTIWVLPHATSFCQGTLGEPGASSPSGCMPGREGTTVGINGVRDLQSSWAKIRK